MPVPDLQGKRTSTPTKQQLYQMTARHARLAIKTLVEVLKNGDNDAARVGAAKTILAKCIPDLKASELTSDGAKTLEGLVQLFTGKNTSE